MGKGFRKWGAMTILGTMTSGLITYLGHHFIFEIPSLKAQVKVLETENMGTKELLRSIHQDVREVRDTQKHIYEMIIK